MMTGTSPRRASSNMLPGSTGMPKWTISPPAATMAAGTVSARSLGTVVPEIMISSLPAASSSRRAAATAAVSWAQRCTRPRWLPSSSMRRRLLVTAAT
jgi:hypothetical protein